jgi:tetratricopeptide (TPR) repeat protein
MLDLKNTKVLGGVALGAIVLCVGAAWGVCTLRTYRVLMKAEDSMTKGFGALAAERIDPVRHEVIRFERGCSVMLSAYFNSRRTERLEWAAQACLEAGKDVPEVYLALAAHRELTGRDAEALRILSQVAPRFDKIPDLYYRMSQILQRNRNVDGAVAAMIQAVERSPAQSQIVLEALEYFSGLQRWNEARQMADKLKSAPTDDPEVKLVIARALRKGGDVGSAQQLIDQAKTLLAQRPEQKARLERAYADMLGGGQQGTAQAQAAAPPQAGANEAAAAPSPAPAAPAKPAPKAAVKAKRK